MQSLKRLLQTFKHVFTCIYHSVGKFFLLFILNCLTSLNILNGVNGFLFLYKMRVGLDFVLLLSCGKP